LKEENFVVLKKWRLNSIHFAVRELRLQHFDT